MSQHDVGLGIVDGTALLVMEHVDGLDARAWPFVRHPSSWAARDEPEVQQLEPEVQQLELGSALG